MHENSPLFCTIKVYEEKNKMIKMGEEVDRMDKSLARQSFLGKTSNVEVEASSPAGCNDDEPLLDYEEYFQDDDSSKEKENCKKGKKKKLKGKSSYKITRPVQNGSSMADQISCQLAQIRASLSQRQPLDVRKETRKNVETRRAKKREEVLERRRHRGAEENGEWSQHGAAKLVGISDPFMYQLLWQFQRLRIDPEIFENGRLMAFRKRSAPSVVLGSYCTTPEIKRRRL